MMNMPKCVRIPDIEHKKKNATQEKEKEKPNCLPQKVVKVIRVRYRVKKKKY